MNSRSIILLAWVLLLVELFTVITGYLMAVGIMEMIPKRFALVFIVQALSMLAAHIIFFRRLGREYRKFRIPFTIYLLSSGAYFLSHFIMLLDVETRYLLMTIYMVIFTTNSIFLLWTRAWYVGAAMILSGTVILLFACMRVSGELSLENNALISLFTILPVLALMYFFSKKAPAGYELQEAGQQDILHE